jgi:response regulator RpfG family c-di-GMP phosphodiesterase
MKTTNKLPVDVTNENKLRKYLDGLQESDDQDWIFEQLETYKEFLQKFYDAYVSLFIIGLDWSSVREKLTDHEFRKLDFSQIVKEHEKLNSLATGIEKYRKSFEELAAVIEAKTDEASEIGERLSSLNEHIFHRGKLSRRLQARKLIANREDDDS